MICCAVGICAITDLKREKNRVQTSNAPFFVEPHDLVADVFGMLEGERAHRAQLDVLDDLLVVEAAELVVALAADAEELDLLALGRSAHWRARAQPHDRRVERPHRPRSAVQTTSRCTWSLPVPAAAAARRRGRRRPRRCCRAPSPCARHRDAPPGRRLRAPQLRGRHHLHGLGDLLRRLGGGDAVAQVLEAGHRCSDLSACRGVAHHHTAPERIMQTSWRIRRPRP